MSLINTEIEPFKATAFRNGTFVDVTDADLRGARSAVFFYPADFTFVCPTKPGDLADNYAAFQELGVEIYSVSTDTHFAHKAWHDTSDPMGKIEYVMVGDPTGALSRNFDVLIEETGLADRGTFVIDPDGRIQIILLNVAGEQMVARARAVLDEIDALRGIFPGGSVGGAGWPGTRVGPAELRPVGPPSGRFCVRQALRPAGRHRRRTAGARWVPGLVGPGGTVRGAMARRTSRDIRVAHRFELLRSVIAGRTVSRAELATCSGLSPATVSNLTGELIEAGLLREVGFQDSGGGRPRSLLAADPAGGVLAGVDVAETYLHVDLFDTALIRLGGHEEALHPEENRPEQVVGHIVSALRGALTQAGVAPDRLTGAGISIPGQVDPRGGVSVFAPNWDWHDVPLREMLRSRLPPAVAGRLPLYLDNPLRAGVLAELWFGAGRGAEDLVVLTLGTGVGAGLAFGGNLFRGATNSAGEWGHTNLVLDGRPCHCGARGCLESYVGAPGIMRTVAERAPGSRLLAAGDQTATITALAEALRDDAGGGGDGDGAGGGDGAGDGGGDGAGDEHGDGAGDGGRAESVEAREVLAVTASYLGTAVADLINLVNPQVVVLSGWVAARLGDPLLERVRAVVEQQALRRPLAAARIVRSPLPGNPVSLGAATFALEGLLTGIGSTSRR